MARPCRAEERELERLESILAELVAVNESCKRLTTRFHQTGRRAKGDTDLLRVFLPCFQELTDIVCAASGARVILLALLEDRQVQRSRHNQGKERENG